MKQQMTRQLALRLIKKNRPKNLLEASQLGLKLVHLGTGAFRRAYKIKGANLVVKFPESEDYLNIIHSRREMRNIKKLGEFKSLRPYLPKIYYHNQKTGVIVMDFYTRYNEKQANKPHPARTYGDISWERELISGLIKELTGVWFNDIWNENLKLDEKNVVKFVDIGC